MTMMSHVRSRHVDTDLHTVWCDEVEGVATFPLFTLLGQMTGFQQYRPGAGKEKKNHPKDGRYYTYSIKESRGVWGLESWRMSETLYITEGIFCAARLTSLGKSAIATMSNDPKFLGGWFKVLRELRPIVAVCDSGSAGMKLAKFAHSHHQMPSGFDLGDAPKEYVMEMIQMEGGQ